MAVTTFGQDLLRFARLTEQSMDQVARATILELSTSIILKTPVDTGRLRGNWQATIGFQAAGDTVSVGAQAAIADVKTALVTAIGSRFYLTNNLPYAAVAEFGLWGTGDGATNKTTRDGYSVQAPYGMVRVSVASYQQNLLAAVNRFGRA